MGIKGKQVAFNFDDSSVQALTPEELKQMKRGKATRFLESRRPAMKSQLTHELDRVYRACQALAANIAEFGAITDPEFIDDVDSALDGLLLPELGQRMENSAALLNTFSVELATLNEKKAAGTDTEGDHTAFLEARDAMLDALLAPVAPGFCSCQGFQACVDLGVIRHASRQLLNTATGTFRTVHYFHLGPDGERGVIIERCPSCGRVIKVNQEALTAIAGEEDHG